MRNQVIKFIRRLAGTDFIHSRFGDIEARLAKLENDLKKHQNSIQSDPISNDDNAVQGDPILGDDSYNPRRDIGREYADPEDRNPRFVLRPGKPLPWSHWTTEFEITIDGKKHTETVNHPHLAILKLLRNCSFDSFMDVGCGEGAEIGLAKHLGKETYSVNFDNSSSFKPDFFGDFFDLPLTRKFGAVYCSHVLEHIRNPGQFLERLIEFVEDDGYLCISVPYHEFGGPPDCINIGHHNRYSLLLLAYQLVSAGLDCSPDVFSGIVYNGQASVLVRKRLIGYHLTTFAPYVDVERFMPIKKVDGGYYSCPMQINWDFP